MVKRIGTKVELGFVPAKVAAVSFFHIKYHPLNNYQMLGAVGSEACCLKRCEPLRHSRGGSFRGRDEMGAAMRPTCVQCFEDEDSINQL